MKVLLDTNVVIHRENTKVTNHAIGLLFYWLDKLHYEKCVHPYSLEELRKFKNANMQELYDAKLSAYTELKTVAPQTDEFISKLPESKSVNDRIDNQLLCEVYSGRVDLLISEDCDLREKSKLLGIKNKVLSINDFVSDAMADNPELISYKMLAVKKELFGNINLNDSFFDTFRAAYPGFDKWFNKKSDEEAYVCRVDGGKILGFLYVKTEDESENYCDIKPVFTPKKRLKIGTFKVESSGFRLGERFIKIIFDNAKQRNVDEIYVTLFEDREELKALESLLLAWGFTYHGTKLTSRKEEVVFVKKLNSYDASKSVVKNFPNMNYQCQKFILPIFPQYHTSLLPDSKLNTENEVDFMENVAHRYALEKVYISWSKERNIRPGDMLLFYRTGENGSNKRYTSVLTSLGVVKSIHAGFRTKEEYLDFCKNRSVFSSKELDDFWEKHRYNLMVLKFVFVTNLTSRLTLDYMWQNNIVPAPNGPRPFTRISDNHFDKILHDSKTVVKFCRE